MENTWTYARYKACALSRFALSARGVASCIKERQLWHDWAQEIELAAWECYRLELRDKQAFAFLARRAYHALTAMGFRRRYLGKKRGYSLKGTWYVRELRVADAPLEIEPGE